MNAADRAAWATIEASRRLADLERFKSPLAKFYWDEGDQQLAYRAEKSHREGIEALARLEKRRAELAYRGKS